MKVPAPAAGDVLVKVSACGMNNTDVWVRQGAYGTEEDAAAVSTWRRQGNTLTFPRIQGTDTVGTIVAVGDGVPADRVGERVTVDFSIYNRDDRVFFDPALKVGPQIATALAASGVIGRAMPQGDILGFAPPLCLTREEADIIVAKTADAVNSVLASI